jgi:serine-type D-Ala-D-Ala carboxypeptidase/endopeptidase (penicillin-binding protein 4)
MADEQFMENHAPKDHVEEMDEGDLAALGPSSGSSMHHVWMWRRWRVVLSAAVTLAVVGVYGLAGAFGLVETPLIFSVDRTDRGEAAHHTVVGAAPLSGSVDLRRPVDKIQAESLLEAFANTRGLGDHYSIAIADGEGHLVASHQANTPFEPASTMKTLTALAASSVLDMGSTFTTSTYLDKSQKDADIAPALTIAGNGDMLLGQGASDPSHINGRAGLATLADGTAQDLLSMGVNQVRLYYDDSLFGNERYPANINDNNPNNTQYTSIASMALDGGRQWAGTGPDDPDSYMAYPQLSETPANDTATLFATLLEARGVTVESGPEQRSLPNSTTVLEQVHSATLSQVLAFALRHSDNTLAELFGRLTALKLGTANSPQGAVQAVHNELGRLGIDLSDAQMADCSGLSPGSKLTARTLIDVQTRNLRAGHAAAAAEGLSVPGLVGTAQGFVDDAESVGLLRVKTGSLDGVSTLTGNVSRRGGGVLSFAIMTNEVTDMDAVHAARNAFIAALPAL